MSTEKKDKYSRYLLLVICLLGLFFVIFDYYIFFIKNDYIVTKQISCDPKIDSCFVSDCESNDSTCDTATTYMKIQVPSKYAGSDYDSLSCTRADSFCKIITCQDSTVEVGEKCFE